MSYITARRLWHHLWAGLRLVGRDEDGNLVWEGEKKNWNALWWLEEGIYEDEKDGGKSIIKEYLTSRNE